MIDIDFYMKVHPFRQRFENGDQPDRKTAFDLLEELRSKTPVVYNIETTNACNMKCKMCPRTTMMMRSVETIDRDTFILVAGQLEPFTETKWREWESFAQTEYGIAPNDMSENHFFLYIIPKVIQLHGYGDPLLDKNIAEYIKILTRKQIPTYFSCNPANINIDKTLKMFENGLSYIKYSIESMDDTAHKQIRGSASNFTKSYKKIVQLLEIKAREGFGTTIVITMLDLNRTRQADEFDMLREAFDGLDVYIYLKSEDTQWYRKDFHQTRSIHWSEFCKHPWMSMTIKSNGEAAMCMEDFNNEIILGNTKKESLSEIWNGQKYKKFREDHFNVTPGIRCTERCDMKLIGHFLELREESPNGKQEN
jgi:radical SAM protein with 4Fe4S-binding SPASM domain